MGQAFVNGIPRFPGFARFSPRGRFRVIFDACGRTTVCRWFTFFMAPRVFESLTCRKSLGISHRSQTAMAWGGPSVDWDWAEVQCIPDAHSFAIRYFAARAPSV